MLPQSPTYTCVYVCVCVYIYIYILYKTTAVYKVPELTATTDSHAVQPRATRRVASVTLRTANQHCSCNQPSSASLNTRVHLCTLNAIRDLSQDDCKEQQNCVQFSWKPIGRLLQQLSQTEYALATGTRGATSAEDCQRSGTAGNVRKLSYSVNKDRRSSNSEIAEQLVCECVGFLEGHNRNLVCRKIQQDPQVKS